jgi:hypothetical protein
MNISANERVSGNGKSQLIMRRLLFLCLLSDVIKGNDAADDP